MSHILFRTDGYTTLGLGHIFRTKILASELMEYGHEIIALTDRGASPRGFFRLAGWGFD